MNFGAMSTKSLDDMYREQMNQLAAGSLDQRGQEFAATIIEEKVSRLQNAYNGMLKARQA